MTNREKAPKLMKFLEESVRGRRPARLGQSCSGSRKEVSEKVQEPSQLDLQSGGGEVTRSKAVAFGD